MKKAGKSILANFGSFANSGTANAEKPGAEVSVAASATSPGARVGAGVIGATQRSLMELRQERDQLQAQVDAGGAAELDPKLIDPSPFPDRLPDDSDHDFDAFKKLMLDEGQKVPIQVRRHPQVEGRYQIVYGHRRWRAASELQIQIKATVLALSDEELVVAQGIENAARQDLSWIERALFVWRMDQANIKARDIRASLSIDDPELARLRAVCRILPIDVIESIGRAPKVGRPRWMALATAASETKEGVSRIRRTLSADKGSALSSDERFTRALVEISKPQAKARNEIALKSPSGRAIGTATFSGPNVKVSMAADHADNFSAFMQVELPALIERYFAQRDEE